jgi:hypothetical protein
VTNLFGKNNTLHAVLVATKGTIDRWLTLHHEESVKQEALSLTLGLVVTK